MVEFPDIQDLPIDASFNPSSTTSVRSSPKLAVADSLLVIGDVGIGDSLQSGSILAYQHNGSIFTRIQTESPIVPSQSYGYDYFGAAVELGRDLSVVGAPGSPSFPGSAWVFSFRNGIWSETRQLQAKSPEVSDDFGRSVSIDPVTDDLIAVGAPLHSSNGVPYAGEVYIFLVSNESVHSTVSPPNPNRFDFFGASVALYGKPKILLSFGGSGTV